MTIDQYIQNINAAYKRGNATEHTYRGDLKQLIESIVPDISATNEPKRQKCGAPDYILMRKDIPVGFIEAKDVGDKDMEGAKKTGNKEQFDRYKASLDNLIFTDYLSFYFYHDGELVTKVSIGETSPDPSKGGEIRAIPGNYAEFTNLIIDFCSHIGQNIKSSKKLAQMMAAKARLLSDVIEKALTRDENKHEDSTLKDQMLAFKEILIHDITPKGFADVYAQTIAYGMFAARLHDTTIESFSRQEAAELIPKSNPFLRKLFSYIAGPDIDDRIRWIVDNLAEVFLACNVEELLKDYGKATKMEDPIIHFYETFLSEYDPALRKARGVWYTPQPVVSFIVRAVDDILKTEFGLTQGLADTSKTKITVKDYAKATSDLRSKTKEIDREMEVHRVQILDPATGTGTFLAETIKHIHKRFVGQQGIWSNYVEKHLLPRLNGFELLMASYAMAHLKLDLLLTETGYKPNGDQRFRVFLTNSLEEHHPDTGTLFANWLSSEANEANRIKRDAPVMVVLGNPPYAVSSINKGEWIQNLIADYKKDLNERKINLDDDYIKFIRYGQHFIDKNGSGVLAYISNNSFIDGITHRQMRKHLLESFDKIYILDLHGFAKIKEVSLIADNDENVFDIQQGVSINIFIKTGVKKDCSVNYFEQYGTRNEKYEFLNSNSLSSIDWGNLKPIDPYYFFVAKDFSDKANHDKGFKISDLFVDSNSAIKTDRDGLFYDSNKENLKNRFKKLLNEELPKSFIDEFNIKDSGSYKITSVIKNKIFDESHIRRSAYRPFDYSWNYYDPKLISRPAQKAMRHFNGLNNCGLIIGRQGQVIGHMQWNLIFCTSTLADYNIFYRGGGYVFPLYLYPETSAQQTIDQHTERRPNLNMEMVAKMAEGLGLEFTNEKVETEGTFAPIDILDYIYAVLHSPTYREKYKEFLKIDFPRVPYPAIDTFWQLVKLGGELRQIHLLESSVVENYITQYPVDGDNVVTKPRFSYSPPSEGCPTGGVVLSSSDGNFNDKQVDYQNDKPEKTIYINSIKLRLNPVLELPYNPLLKKRARELRQAENLTEVLFWMQVTKGGFHNIDFDRQRIIGNYIVDFYVKKFGLVIEIDGSSHIGKEDYDREREDYLRSLGLRIYRIEVIDILKRMDKVISKLENYLIENYGEPTQNLGTLEPPRLSSTPPKEEEPPRLSSTPPKEEEPPRLSGTPPKEGNLGRVYINETQYFDNVPEVAWNFYIGGYQPAQKWLKDRKDRKLEMEDVFHYQKIIVALTETDRIMKEIDGIGVEW